MEWVVVTVALLTIVISIAVLIVFLFSSGNKEPIPTRMWYVELWNICYGYVVQLQFSGAVVVGRESIYQYSTGSVPPEPDCTVSMEHCMLYEQCGQIFAANMSVVNPTVINGRRANTPCTIHPGDRLELGKSVFLITRVMPLERT